MEVPIFLKLRLLWNGPLRNLATQPVSWPVKRETALNIDDSSVFLTFFFCEFLVFKSILVIHCCFQNKNLYQNY
jgi:hypothetical protein